MLEQEWERFLERALSRRKMLQRAGILLAGGTLLACGSEKKVETGQNNQPEDQFEQIKDELVLLENDQTPLDFNCSYWIDSGDDYLFSGPYPHKQGGFQLLLSVEIVSENEVMFGPFSFKPGQKIGLHFRDDNITVPLGLIESIKFDRVRFTHTVPSKGQNDCPDVEQ